MMPRSARVVIAALGFLVCTIGTARAEGESSPAACPEDALGHVSAVRGYFEQREGPINADAVADANLLEALCADQFITMYQLADTWYQLLFRTDLSLDEQGTIANRALTILVNADKAPFVPHNYEEAGVIRKRVVDTAIGYAEAGGPREPFFVEGGEFGSCDNAWGNITQTLWYAYRDDWKGEVTPILIANASLSCKDKPRLNVHDYFAALRAEQARREPDPVKALALMEEARAANLLYAGSNSDTDKQAKFDREYNAMALALRSEENVLSDAEIFSAANVGTDRALLDLAWKINQVWQPVERLEDGTAVAGAIKARLEGYYERVQQLEAVAKAQGIDAQRLLFKVLKGHAEKVYRTRETADLTDPLRMIWAARDPDGAEPLTNPEG